MEIIVGKSAGFCYGVERAVNTVYKESQEHNICTLGPIIHNDIVIKDLEKRNVKVIENIEDFQGDKLIIRSHGVPKRTVEELEKNKIKYIDCTCLDVKKIHKIVKKSSSMNKKIIIIGNFRHPEVVGIKGWSTTEVIVIESNNDENILKLKKKEKYVIVVQTTYNKDNLKKIINKIEERSIDFILENTICRATIDRQEEVVEIAKKVDHMIILGGKKSSNTNKLYILAKKNCKNTYFIETIKKLSLSFVKKNAIIGVMAGASTPKAIIKEAIIIMNEELNDEMSFEEMLEKSLENRIKNGDIVTGTVLRIVGEEVFVNVKHKSDGIIPYGEFASDTSIKASESVKVGDDIEVFVLTLNDGDGNVLLSKKRIEEHRSFLELEKIYDDKEIVMGRVLEVIKGGLMALIRDNKIFVPASQISASFTKDLHSFVGKELEFHIIEFNKTKRKVVAGRKEIAQKEMVSKRAEIFAKIDVNSRLKGVVRRIVDYGAFVDIGGIDGLIHISELAWCRVRKVTDIVNVDDEVEVVVIDIDKEKGKVALSLKGITENPWNDAVSKFKVGNNITGKVVRIVDFGAFVEIEPGVDALLHISQISHNHTDSVASVLKVAQEIEAQVIDLDLENKKISISMKILEEAPEEEITPEEEISSEK